MIVGLIGAALLLGGCRRGAPQGRATIEIRNGIRIVRNPVDPAPTEVPQALVEDLVLEGSGGDERLSFGAIPTYGSLDVDSSGNIYVADNVSSRIAVVDPRGRFLRDIGRGGQGPGEFESISALRVLPDGRIAVYDRTHRRLSFFDPDGRLAGELSLALHPSLFTPQIDSRGDVFGVVLFAEGTDRVMELLRISADGKTSSRIARSTRELPRNGVRRRLSTTRLDFRLTPQDGIIWSEQKDYVLNVADNAGRLRAIVHKAYVPLSLTRRDIAAGMRPFFEPGSRPAWTRFAPLSMLLVADDGRIFVRTRERASGVIRYAFDVFDGEGVFLYRTSFGGTPLLIRQGRLYSSEEAADGAFLIKRYVMKPAAVLK